MNRQRLVTLTLLLALAPLELLATNAAERGLEIAREADRRDSGFGNYTAELAMILTNRSGQQVTRKLRRKTLEVAGDGDKDLSIFEAPRDVKGTAALIHAHPLDPDDQWIFLPAVKRVKRVSSANKSGPFVGSEFAFEDITRQELPKYSYRYLREEVVDGKDCFVLELVPAYKYSGYSRLIQWLDKSMYQPAKIDYFDRKNDLLKTLTFRDYQQYAGRYWRPGEMLMENHRNGKATTLVWKNYQFQVGLTERDFSHSALKRAR